jgi:hypothetical protein
MLRLQSETATAVAMQAQMFVRSRTVVSRTVAGETLIVPIRGKVGDLSSIYSFNEVGSLIWRLLDTPRQLSELVSAVEQTYEVRMERAEQDVLQFLEEMLTANLVEATGKVIPLADAPVGREGLSAMGAL